MTSVITGDIINSKTENTAVWIEALKTELNKHGKAPENWEIYRGDSFQLETTPEKAIKVSLSIKATIKQFKTLDVRLAIGIGDKDYDAKSITESNGSAFINSGECFEGLKKSTLAIKTHNKTFDDTINIMLELTSLTIDNWTPKAAILFRTALEHPNHNQHELEKILNRKQSNISAGLKRSGYDEISKFLHFYKQQVETL